MRVTNMPKPTKAQTMYAALRARGYGVDDATRLVLAGPLCRSRHATSRAFIAWTRTVENESN